jgi:hypothetical protein
MMSSNDQEGGWEGEDMEMQQQNRACNKFPWTAECLDKMIEFFVSNDGDFT